MIYADRNNDLWRTGEYRFLGDHKRDKDATVIYEILDTHSRDMPNEIQKLLQSGQAHTNEKDEHGSTPLVVSFGTAIPFT